MSNLKLSSLAISDFRSIRGKAVIPLEAPIVLLHGTNGAGKSTVMTALELALTGSAAAIGHTDPTYLINRGAERAQIDLLTSAGNVGITVDASGIRGDGLLQSEDARFFRERCHLQQRTLSRLLEEYQEHTGDGKSALTSFVNELLGLDALDALDAGLHPASHKARLKRIVPNYAEVDQVHREREVRINELEAEQQEAERAAAAARDDLASLMDLLGAPAGLKNDLEASAAWLRDKQAADEESLVRLLSARRELAAVASHASSQAHGPDVARIAGLERAAASAREAANQWQTEYGGQLEAILDDIRQSLPGIPAAGGAGDPSAIHAAALAQTSAEIDRLAGIVQADEKLGDDDARLEQTISQIRLRIEAIQGQLEASPALTAAEDFAGTLASLAPHVHSDDCPVCGRNYAEIGNEPLSAHLAQRIAELTTRAEFLGELTRASNEAFSELGQAEAERAATARRRLHPETKALAQETRSRLLGAQRRLVEITAGVSDGASLVRRRTETERDSAIAREQNVTASALRRAVEAQAASLGQPAPPLTTPTNEAADSLISHVASSTEALERLSLTRRQAETAIGVVRTAVTAHAGLERRLTDLEVAHTRTAEALGELDQRRTVMRELRDEVQRTRTQILRRVFTGSLNRVWRDLFVRLAPEEPFVPAFRVPLPNESVVDVALETVHRDGKPGGPPAAMLSAGNLNTAALTLFLALNLSVDCRVPWILLDDPVQSMDEVHIAQFAALLRTLSREHGRRLVIAVHERALFDYLTLELSPATETEGLQTVELTRRPDGATRSEPAYQEYVPDRALETA